MTKCHPSAISRTSTSSASKVCRNRPGISPWITSICSTSRRPDMTLTNQEIDFYVSFSILFLVLVSVSVHLVFVGRDRDRAEAHRDYWRERAEKMESTRDDE